MGGRTFQRSQPSWLGERSGRSRDSAGTRREEQVPTGWERMEVMDPKKYTWSSQSHHWRGAAKVWGRTGTHRCQEGNKHRRGKEKPAWSG